MSKFSEKGKHTNMKIPFSGVCQSTTSHTKYREASGHRDVNIRYTIRIKQATPGVRRSTGVHASRVTRNVSYELVQNHYCRCVVCVIESYPKKESSAPTEEHLSLL